LASSIKENPRLRAAAEELRKTGAKVGDAVSEAMKAMEDSDLMRNVSIICTVTFVSSFDYSHFPQIAKASAAVSTTISTATKPVRDTAAYKVLSETVLDALDDSGSSKYGGYEEKEARRKRREQRLLKAGRSGGLAAGSKRVSVDPKSVSRLLKCLFHAQSAHKAPESQWSYTKMLQNSKPGIN
jgi:import inner membrane translocase subunit TIM44